MEEKKNIVKIFRGFEAHNVWDAYKLKIIQGSYLTIIISVLYGLYTSGAHPTLLITISTSLFVVLGSAFQFLFPDVIFKILIKPDRSVGVGYVVEVNKKEVWVLEIKLKNNRAFNWDAKVIINPNLQYLTGSILVIPKILKVL